VSRLYDRIRTQGTRAVTAADLHTHSVDQSELKAQFAEDLRARGLEPTADSTMQYERRMPVPICITHAEVLR
jgi:hypothetical protein